MTTMNDAPATGEVASFLAEYASWLLGCGATCIRIEKNVRRIAARYGMMADVQVMPAHVQLSVWPQTHTNAAVMSQRRIVGCGINFSINAALSRLSWAVADDALPFGELCRRFADTVERKCSGRRLVPVFAALANASFCRLFGGDVASMGIVLLATLAGFRIRQIMVESGKDVRVAVLVAAFVSSTLSAGCHIFDWGATPGIALGTSVLYLIPGVPYINALSDMFDRHYLCAFSRFVDASATTACIAAGLCAGMLLLGIQWF